ncbi:Urea transporter [Mucilaginibacter mallensis]|uniref:Urea transporter n=1 Tax=Mucilaginibacter mallensis TaxID=652787 RepID=A0A1H1ZFI7_MUCMA|nr:urea transporter [Mucilaginibacter mallensis]SDT32551.1 Urea transporter [Mucilaginibacter mallensis]
MKNRTQLFIKAVVNSYAILFFSQNKVLGAILLLVSFFNPVAGLCGLCCVVFSLAVTNLLGYRTETINAGIYSFNSLLLGIAFGSFYNVNGVFYVWLALACLFTTIVSVALVERLGRSGLPVLSLPFIFCFWIVLLAANSVFHTGLEPKSSYILGELYNGTGNLGSFHEYLYLKLPFYLNLFFRSLSAILFQNNVITGILISVGLLVHSRITFSLLIIGFITALYFNNITHVYPDGISYYHLGANFMLTSVAIGSFFTIPSLRSYLWAIVCVLIVFVLINALTTLLSIYNLPVFSLPFCIINIGFLYFLLLRRYPGKLQLVPIQHYSPERNLYQFINQKSRLNDLKYFRFYLPFMGSWTVSQGYDGDITHKGDWGKALDFVIEDEEKHTYKLPGTLPEHFYCFNKPVLACADGVVTTVTDHIEDNIIGEVNTKDNWGNTVVIKHLDGLYSKVSHLKKKSITVKPGDVVKQGDQIGLCGNSGRSPEPHLHFQVQTTSYIDAKTLAYPFAGYISREANKNKFNSFEIPAKEDILNPVNINTSIKRAFDFPPGYTATITLATAKESIEAFTDEFNQTYFYCKETGAIAYFINNGTLFYFTSFYGDKNSLLYYFYLSAYKIIFSSDEDVIVHDTLPVQLSANKLQLWLQDLVAPFYRFISINYSSRYLPQKTGLAIKAVQFKQIFGRQKQTMTATINIVDNSIHDFDIQINGRDTKAEWIKEST